MTFRTNCDAARIYDAARATENVAIIGAGLIELELAAEPTGARHSYAVMAIATHLAVLCQTLIDLTVRSRSNGAEGASTQHFLDPKLVLPEIL